MNCTAGNAGKWYDGTACVNGKAANITFDFSSQNLTLPDTVVYGISYNTTSYGPSPIGTGASCYSTAAGCPYDSLNIGLSTQVVIRLEAVPRHRLPERDRQ